MEFKSLEEMRLEIEAQLVKMSEPLIISKSYPDPHWYLNACLSPSGGDWDIYAVGYKKAGDTLVQYVLDKKCDQDFLVYPIIFLYRQYLELRLKELIFIGSWLQDKSAQMPKTHNLSSLWKQARVGIEEVWPDRETKNHLDVVEARLKELGDIDSGSYAFRYPEDTKGDASLVGLEHINLKQVCDVVQGMSHILDGSIDGMGEHLQAKREMMAEYRAEMRSFYNEY